MNIEEYSKFVDVPLLRAGRFYPKLENGQASPPTEYTEQELDELVQDSNGNLAFIAESIETGQYRGNPHVRMTKPIPSFVNLSHQSYLRDTLKTAMKNVTVSFGKKLIDGVSWLTGTFDNIPQEWAALIKDKFPLRSVEIISGLTHPDTNTPIKKLIRSVGFLDRMTLPAVHPQPSDFAVEFVQEQDESVLILYSNFINNPTQEDKPMETQEQILNDVPFDTTTPPIEVPAGVSLQEFNALQASVLEMQRENETTKQENATLKSRLDAETDKREGQEITMFCESLKTQPVTNSEGVFVASQAFVDMSQAMLKAADNSAIIEFYDKKQSQRASVQEFVGLVYEMAAKGSILVPVGEYHIGDKTEPDSDNFKSLPLKEQREQAIQEFMGSADNNYSKAWRLAADSDKYRSIF